MTKNEIIVKLDELGLEFDATAKKSALEALLITSDTSTPKEIETPLKTDNDRLVEAIDKTIEIADEIMLKDRSRVLRLKNLVGKLEDAKRVIK